MLRRISKCVGVGGFVALHHPADDGLKFRRLSLVYARNGSGKSTIARLLSAASRGDADELIQDRRLADPVLPSEVLLELDGGRAKFDGTVWSGIPPKVAVFGRGFIERNVHVGRAHGKDQ